MENRKPVWKHKSVFDVSQEEIEAIFTPNEFTKKLELEASSFVPLNGPVFRYIQNKSTPVPLVGGTFFAEADVERRELSEDEADPLGYMIYRKSQMNADRIFYKTNPEALEDWLPGGDKADIIASARGELDELVEKEVSEEYTGVNEEYEEEEEYSEEEEAEEEEEYEEEEEEYSEEEVSEYLKTATTNSRSTTDLLPDYDFLKTEDPPAESVLETDTETETIVDTSSPYYEEIYEETFPIQDDTVRDDDLIVRSDGKQSDKSNTKLWDQYYSGQPNLQRGEKMWITKLRKEDEY